MEVSHQDSSLKSHLETRTKILTSGTVTVPNPLLENTNAIQSTTKHPKHPANFWNNTALTYLTCQFSDKTITVQQHSVRREV